MAPKPIYSSSRLLINRLNRLLTWWFDDYFFSKRFASLTEKETVCWTARRPVTSQPARQSDGGHKGADYPQQQLTLALRSDTITATEEILYEKETTEWFCKQVVEAILMHSLFCIQKNGSDKSVLSRQKRYVWLDGSEKIYILYIETIKH